MDRESIENKIKSIILKYKYNNSEASRLSTIRMIEDDKEANFVANKIVETICKECKKEKERK